MDLHTINTLEFDKIINILSDFAVTYLGKNKCLKLLPINNIDTITLWQNETNEALRLIQKKGNIPICEIDNIIISLKKLESYGVLSAKEILSIGKILKLSRNLKHYFFEEHDDVDISFALDIENYFSSLYTNIDIEKSIFDTILDEYAIADRATTELYNIRRKQKDLENRIRDRLNQIITSSKYSKFLQDNVVTIKNERFVIPVKQECRSEIPGLVHDISSSGATVFIEPTSVFDMNNSIKELKILEEHEIEKILKNLSDKINTITDNLFANLDLIGYIDFIFAKAKYALNLRANIPNLNTDGIIILTKARNPLIEQNKVVPIDISIGTDFSSLVITGPNTGGKTVTLKTIGLLTLMACSGLHIPADEKSILCVFDNVFADIGDEQSIQESLSTFSSHMVNIVKILKYVSCNSLVILDELRFWNRSDRRKCPCNINSRTF